MLWANAGLSVRSRFNGSSQQVIGSMSPAQPAKADDRLTLTLDNMNGQTFQSCVLDPSLAEHNYRLFG